MNLRLAATLSLLLTTTPAQDSTTPDHVLDLVATPPSTEEDSQEAVLPTRLRVHCPGGPPPVHSETRVALPLQLTLLSLDRAAYAIGDTFVFEVLVENVGEKPLAFPTQLDPGRFTTDTPGARLAALSLYMKDETLGEHVIGLVALHGAESVAGSMVKLEPAQTLKIRSQGRWYLGGDMPGLTSRDEGWRESASVFALINLSHYSNYYPPIRSSNGVEVLLLQQ